MAENKTITIDLGDMRESLEARLASGAYSSADEVVREALRALDREEQEPESDDDFLRRKIAESLADPRPGIPAKEVFERLERKHEARMRARRRAV